MSSKSADGIPAVINGVFLLGQPLHFGFFSPQTFSLTAAKWLLRDLLEMMGGKGSLFLGLFY